jgi:hypothetical protein
MAKRVRPARGRHQAPQGWRQHRPADGRGIGLDLRRGPRRRRGAQAGAEVSTRHAEGRQATRGAAVALGLSFRRRGVSANQGRGQRSARAEGFGRREGPSDQSGAERAPRKGALRMVPGVRHVQDPGRGQRVAYQGRAEARHRFADTPPSAAQRQARILQGHRGRVA